MGWSTEILSSAKPWLKSYPNPNPSPDDGARGDAVTADLALRGVHQRRRHLVEAGAEAIGAAARRRRRRARGLQGDLRQQLARTGCRAASARTGARYVMTKQRLAFQLEPMSAWPPAPWCCAC